MYVLIILLFYWPADLRISEFHLKDLVLYVMFIYQKTTIPGEAFYTIAASVIVFPCCHVSLLTFDLDVDYGLDDLINI